MDGVCAGKGRGAGGASSGRRPCFVCARRPLEIEPCGRDRPAPSFPPRLGPQTLVGGQFRKRLRSAADCRHPLGTRRRLALEGPERCGTRTTPETRRCCSGCSGCSCCGWPSARCPDCCSRTRRAAHGIKSTGDPTGYHAGGADYAHNAGPLPGARRAGWHCPGLIGFRGIARVEKNARRRRYAPSVPLARHSVISVHRWGPRTTPETRRCRTGSPGRACRGWPSARRPDCRSRTRRAAHAGRNLCFRRR